jgi:ent-copalyl diphosphate synthase
MEWTAENGSYKGNTALLLVRTVEICSGRLGSTEQNLKLPEYSQLEQLTYSICSKLDHGIQSQPQVCSLSLHTENVEILDGPVDEEMQELAQRVFQISDPMNRVTKQTFLHVARSYCYVAHCSPETIDSHISKVLFEEVI